MKPLATAWTGRLFVVLFLFSAGACNRDPANGDAGGEAAERPAVSLEAVQVAKPGAIPAFEQRSGDPARGRQALLEEGYVECGLPARLWREGQFESTAQLKVERSGASSDLPYFLNAHVNADGVELAVSNCLTCHGAPLFGEVVIGLGNEFADFTDDPSIAVERAGLLVQGDAETAAWERFADRIAAIAPHVQMPTVGSNPANNLTFALMAHRNPETQQWSQTPLLPLPTTEPPPVSVPPWWRMSKKHAMFNLGEGRGDHARLMMAASMMCTDERAGLEDIDEYAPDIRAFISSIEPPRWPFGLDEAMATTGKALFESNCSACHGTYGEDGRYPNRLVDINVVGTDPVLMQQALDTGGPYIDWLNRSYYGELSEALPGRGYVAPPLDGVWATGPYLHNGSVPTIAGVLDSSTRPELWTLDARSGNEQDAFDTAGIGWTYQTLSEEQAAALAPEEQRRVYDTRRHGHNNSGHTFGDAFDAAQRAAVIEYLKSL